MSDVVLRRPAAALEHGIGLLPRRDLDAAVRHAAWVARCVGAAIDIVNPARLRKLAG